MTKLRVVLDTNVIISSLFWSGPPHEVALRGIDGKIDLLTSTHILDETERKLRDKFGIPDADNAIAIGALINHAEMVYPKQVISAVKDDPSDNRIIECAIAGKADYIVTGDRHLLNLKSFKGVPIISAPEFLRVFRRN